MPHANTWRDLVRFGINNWEHWKDFVIKICCVKKQVGEQGQSKGQGMLHDAFEIKVIMLQKAISEILHKGCVNSSTVIKVYQLHFVFV